MNFKERMARLRRKHAPFLALAAATLVALSLAASSGADLVKPTVSLGPVTVLNGTATLAGSVASPTAGTTMSVNGHPFGIDAVSGQFAGAFDLAGQTKLDITVRNPATGQVSTTSIPLNSNTVGPGGLISPQVLASLEQAGVSLLKPLDGFGILDGLPLDLQGGVLDSGKLAALQVNGIDVLDRLKDGSFALTVPGTTREITVTATDRNGVTHSSTHEVRTVSSVVSTPFGPSVAAAGALGLRVTSIRHALKGVKKTRRFRTLVVVKDSRGYLVRGATVVLRPLTKKRLRAMPRAVKTNKIGRANFVLRPAKKTFGKRFILQASAKTPSAKASKRSYVKLPRLAKPAARR